MRNIIFFIAIAALIAGGYMLTHGRTPVVSYATSTPVAVREERIIVPPTLAPVVDENKSADYPVQLSIPKLNIDTAVQSVGLDDQGRMATPTGIEEVGWYKLGYRPGEKGSAVIAGHFDGKQGEPGVFYHLNNLNKGDDIIVKTQQGKTYTYTVTRKETFSYTQLPLLTIFGSSDKARLNLITCSGTFDTGKTTYLERLVVFTELKIHN